MTVPWLCIRVRIRLIGYTVLAPTQLLMAPIAPVVSLPGSPSRSEHFRFLAFLFVISRFRSSYVDKSIALKGNIPTRPKPSPL